MLATNSPAPDFTLTDQDNQTHTLANYNTWKVIYFYPKDDTPGCTTEACTIAEVYDEFAAKGITVFGISKDSPASHKAFAEKYHLPFTLLSDEAAKVIKAYEAWDESTEIGTIRVSYLVSPDNNIVYTYPHVDPATHAHEILRDFDVINAT